MAAYRCEQCDIDWPHQVGFTTCRQCKQTCSYRTIDAMDADETRSAIRHIEFEEFYTEREATRLSAEIEAHGVTPKADPSPGRMRWEFPKR